MSAFNFGSYVKQSKTPCPWLLNAAEHLKPLRSSLTAAQDSTAPGMKRKITAVGDEAVNPFFNTGTVEVTPAYNSLDFKIAGHARLPPVQVISDNGLMTVAVGTFCRV